MPPLHDVLRPMPCMLCLRPMLCLASRCSCCAFAPRCASPHAVHAMPPPQAAPHPTLFMLCLHPTLHLASRCACYTLPCPLRVLRRAEYVGKDNPEVRIGAILGLGIAYAGRPKEDVAELLLPLVMDSELSMEVGGALVALRGITNA